MKTINSKGISTVAIVGIVVIVLLAGGLAWWQTGKNDNNNGNSNANTNISTNTNNNQNSNANVNVNQNVNTNSINLNTSVNTTGWKEYKNTDVGFSITIPSEWYRISEWDGSCCRELDPKDTSCVFGTQKGINMAYLKIISAQSLEYYLTRNKIDKYAKHESINSNNVSMMIYESLDAIIDEDTLNKYIVIINVNQDKNTYVELGFNELDNINKKVLDSFSF